MRRDTMYLGNYIPTFQGNLLQDREREKTVYSFLLKELTYQTTRRHILQAHSFNITQNNRDNLTPNPIVNVEYINDDYYHHSKAS